MKKGATSGIMNVQWKMWGPERHTKVNRSRGYPRGFLTAIKGDL